MKIFNTALLMLTALSIGSVHGTDTTVKPITENTISITLMSSAIKQNDLKKIRALLPKYAQKLRLTLTKEEIKKFNEAINHPDAQKFSALRIAAENGLITIATILLKYGTDCTNKTDLTPLYNAVLNGHIKTTHLLLTHGANPNAYNQKNFTPLLLAMDKTIKNLKKYGPLVSMLIKHGAITYTTPKNLNASPIQLAKKTNNTFLIERCNLLSQYTNGTIAFQNHPEKMYLACTLIAHTKQWNFKNKPLLPHIRRDFLQANFSPQETQEIIQHLGYICPNLNEKDCAEIIWLLPTINNEQMRTILSLLPVQEQQKLILRLLGANNLRTMQSKQALCDTKFEFE